MPKILLAVDGSENALRACRTLIEHARWYRQPPEVEMLAVLLPLPYPHGLVRKVVTREMVEDYFHEEAKQWLAPCRTLLDEAGVPCHERILVGQIAQTIVEHAESSGCQMIYLGTRGMSAISNLVLGSVATKVVHLAQVPVTLVK